MQKVKFKVEILKRGSFVVNVMSRTLHISIDQRARIMMSKFIKYLGGRKSAMFTLTLITVFLLAILNKASSSTLGLIDTLYLVYAGSNVATKFKTDKEESKNEQ